VIEAPEVREFANPSGRVAHMSLRPGTNDHNTIASCMTSDEYRLASLPSVGVAVDVGAYTGGVTVALAMLGWRVIAVEALSENVVLLRENVERNVKEPGSVTILHSAAAKSGKKSAAVHWNFSGDESGQHHRFVGNAQWLGVTGGEMETVPTVTLAKLVEIAGGHIDFLKADCEGCEYGLFDSPALEDVTLIHGEYHSGAQRLQDLLSPTHDVTIEGSEHFGAFTARLR
jgi:FkbM family methyltransferase